jgi:hypothetical protein
MTSKNRSFALAVISFALVGTAACTGDVAGPDLKPNADEGQAQFISAIDAGWVRVLASGQYRDILNDPANAAVPQGDLPVNHVVNISDCLPNSELTPYPENPTGLLKRMLETGEVKRCVIEGAPIASDTTNFFRHTEKIEDAIFAEIENHYGVTINRTDVVSPPPIANTTELNNGSCDYINQVNALGGRTEGLRRRDTRLFSCTVTASSQYLHVPTTNRGGGLPDTDHIDSVDDLLAASGLRICSGGLSTQLANKYFANHKVDSVFIPGDIAECAERVFGEGFCDCPRPSGSAPACENRPSDNVGGICPVIASRSTGPIHDDIIINPLGNLDAALFETAYVGRLTSIDTRILAGTPLWVAIKSPR